MLSNSQILSQVVETSTTEPQVEKVCPISKLLAYSEPNLPFSNAETYRQLMQLEIEAQNRLDTELALHRSTFTGFNAGLFQLNKQRKALEQKRKLRQLPHSIEHKTLILHVGIEDANRNLAWPEIYKILDWAETQDVEQVSYPYCCGSQFCTNAIRNQSFVRSSIKALRNDMKYAEKHF